MLYQDVIEAFKYFRWSRGRQIDRKMPDAKHGYWPIDLDKDSTSNNFSTTLDYLRASQMISWSSICCNKIATKTSMTPWGIADEDGEEINNPELFRLFKYPNPYMTFTSMMEIIDWHMLLAGNAYIWKFKKTLYDASSKGKYSELWILNPACVEVIKSEKNYIDGYKVRFGYKDVTLKPEEVLHLKEPNPIDDRVGMGKIQANEILYNTEYAAQYYNWQFFAKGGAPATGIVIPDAISLEQRNEIEARFEKYRGVKNSHKFIVLTDGMDVKNIGLSQKDMAFIEQRKFTREEILGIFGVPPAVAGIFEYANYANSKEQNNMFLADTIQPRLVKRAQAFTLGILRDFEKNPDKPIMSFWFENVIRKDEELNMKLYIQGVQSGGLTPNEGREMYLDLPKVDTEGMDEHYMPINMIPISGMTLTEPVASDGKSFQQTKKITLTIRQQIYRNSLLTRKRIGKTIKKEMRVFFDEQEARVIAALNTHKSLPTDRKLSAQDIFDFNREKDEIVKRIKKGHMGIIARSIEDINESLGTTTDSSTANPKVTEGIAKLGQGVVRVNQTTKDEIDAAVRAGVDAGESISEIKNRIEAVFDKARGYRAEMIARTESAAAYDQGSLLAYKDAEIGFVDVFGCEDNETDCNRQHVPIDEADDLEFHPNHTGVIVPEIS